MFVEGQSTGGRRKPHPRASGASKYRIVLHSMLLRYIRHSTRRAGSGVPDRARKIPDSQSLVSLEESVRRRPAGSGLRYGEGRTPLTIATINSISIPIMKTGATMEAECPDFPLPSKPGRVAGSPTSISGLPAVGRRVRPVLSRVPLGPPQRAKRSAGLQDPSTTGKEVLHIAEIEKARWRTEATG
jgi:hypothetical protein